MIKLGDKVKDKVSQLSGIAVCRITYLNGCDRIGIQQPVEKDGKMPDVYYIDEPQCEIIGKGKFYGISEDDDLEGIYKKTGGPSSKYISNNKL